METDDVLLSGMAAGDPVAAGAFVRRFQGRVHGLARTLVADRDTAEDVTQEAFLRAYRHAASYDPRRGSVATWLLAITRNLAIDVIRVRRARPVDPAVVLAAVETLDPSPGYERVAELVDQAAANREVRAAVDVLPAEQRRAVLLAALGGLSATEVANAEGIPLGTAKARIRRGMRRLRDVLGPSEPSGSSADPPPLATAPEGVR